MESTIPPHRRLPIHEALKSALRIEDPKPAATRRLYMAPEHILLMLAHAARHFVQVLEQRDRTNTSAAAMRDFFDSLLEGEVVEIEGKAMMHMPDGYMNEQYGEWVEAVPAMNGWIDCLSRIAPALSSTALKALRDAMEFNQELGEFLVMAARMEFEAHVDHMKTMRPSEINAAVNATRAEWRKEEMEKTMNTNTEAQSINAAHELLMRAEDALSVTDVARELNDTKKPNKSQIKAAERLLKELNGMGLIEAEPRAGGVPFYRLIVAPASNINDMPEVGDTDVVELSRSVEASAPAIAPAIMQAITEDARNEQADEADGWITFEVTADSVSPVPDGTFLKYRMADGSECKDFAENLRWWSAMSSWGDPGADIVAYKIIAKAPADFATTPELQYLAHEDYEMPPADPDFLAQANRALGEQLEAVKAELEIERGRLAACGVVAMCDTPESAKKARDMREEYRSASCDDVARRVDECMALRTERDDLRARLDAVTQQSIADTDALTAQIEHLRAELAERDSHLHKITSDTGRSDIAQRLIDHNDDRLYHEADMLMYEASDAITMLEHERDQLRAELETARAEAIALKTLEGAMPGFGTAHDAQRIASLTAELQALRTCSANAINEADRLRAELATERQAREALQEQAGDDVVDVKDAAVGYLVRVPKRRPMMRTKPESARAAALSAVRSGAAHAEVLAVVPVGTARRGAEWRGA